MDMTEQEFVDRWGQAEHYDSGEYTYADQREECLEDLHLLIDPMLVEAFVQGAHWFSCGYSGKSIPAARATRLLAAGKLGKVGDDKRDTKSDPNHTTKMKGC